MHSLSRTRRSAAAVLGVIFLLGGCRSDGRTLRKPDVEQAPTGITGSFPALGSSSQPGVGSASSTATPVPQRAILRTGQIPVYAEADLVGDPIQTLNVPNEFATITALPIAETNAEQTSLQVELPGMLDAPQIGWIASSDATIDSNTQSLVVDPIRRQLALYEGDDIVLNAEIGIGSLYPEIAGRTEFAVAVLAAPTAGGELGDFGIAGSTTTQALTAFVAGSTQVVIHGVRDSVTLATPNAPGMVRMDSETLEQLVRILLPATPLHFQADAS